METKFNGIQQEILGYFRHIVKKSIDCFNIKPFVMSTGESGIFIKGFIITSGELKQLIQNENDFVVFYNGNGELAIYNENETNHRNFKKIK